MANSGNNKLSDKNGGTFVMAENIEIGSIYTLFLLQIK